MTQNNITQNNVTQNNISINNIHNHQQVVNQSFQRPGGWGGWGWGGGWNSPGYNHWGDYWYDRHVHHHHHGWYHGCWGGNWSTVWVAPFAFGAMGWGSSNFLYSSGYIQYYNPYATQVVFVQGVDYSRPIIIQQVVAVEAPSDSGKVASGVPQPAAVEPGLAELDEARVNFKAGQYQQARVLTERSLQLRPGDPAAHEFYALCLFAVGEYQAASAVLNALLATAPGWDWTTMSSLYGQPARYEQQLRALEAESRRNPNNPGVQFVLAYHYLVCGHGEQAIPKLRQVVELQPRDTVSKKLLQTLESAQLARQQADATPEEERLAQGNLPRPEELERPQPQPPEDQLAERPELTVPEDPAAEEPVGGEEDDDADFFDLVGEWVADLPQGGKVVLTITEESQFTWRLEPASGEVKSIEGSLNSANDLLVLESPQEGTMVGRAEVVGGAEFRFVLQGGPPDDPGLTFRKTE